MKIKALHDNVVVRLQPKQTQVGSIVLPDIAKEDTKNFLIGTVIDVGPGKEYVFVKEGPMTTKPPVQVGDRLLIRSFDAEQRFTDREGNEIAVVANHALLAKLEE